MRRARKGGAPGMHPAREEIFDPAEVEEGDDHRHDKDIINEVKNANSLGAWWCGRLYLVRLLEPAQWLGASSAAMVPRLRNSAGSMRLLFRLTLQCRWGPVTRPVIPTRAMMSPC
jgi:hypothetical protein